MKVRPLALRREPKKAAPWRCGFVSCYEPTTNQLKAHTLLCKFFCAILSYWLQSVAL